MQKLHLVGFTTDHEGLILSARRGTRSGGYLLTVDQAVATAVEAVVAQRDGAALDEADSAAERAPRVESTLPVREIQARLRQGRSIADVAKAAGVTVDWVERFAAPVLAERAQVIARVQRVPLRRPRLGPSQHPIGDAVRHNLADRGVMLSPDEFRDAWTARQVADGRWAVRCSFQYRAKKQVLRFDLVEATGEVTAADRTSSQLGYVAPAATGRSSAAARRTSPSKTAARPTVKRATASSGYRPDRASSDARSRSAKERERAAAAMRKAAAKRAAEAERAAARRARERAAEAARKERAAKAEADRVARIERQRLRDAATKAKAKAKAVAAKQAEAARAKAAKAKAAKAKAAKKAAAERAKKAAAKKKTTAKKATTAKKTTATKHAAAKRATPKKPAAKRKTAPTKKKTTAKKKARAKKTTAKKTPAKKTPVTRSSTPRATTRAQPAPIRAVLPSPSPRPVPRPVAPTSGTPRPVEAPLRSHPLASPEPRSELAPSIRPVAATPAPTPGPVFRQGLVEEASASPTVRRPVTPERDAEPGRPDGNGLGEPAPSRRPDRPRRTQPLRAT